MNQNKKKWKKNKWKVTVIDAETITVLVKVTEILEKKQKEEKK